MKLFLYPKKNGPSNVVRLMYYNRKIYLPKVRPTPTPAR